MSELVVDTTVSPSGWTSFAAAVCLNLSKRRRNRLVEAAFREARYLSGHWSPSCGIRREITVREGTFQKRFLGLER